ncbi:putative fructosyl amino acid protein [Lasiosphaeria hispida]|uniref:Fructosyl amino acid protein n=1 Tax=Lasiosphaeria hispida TaxID=260671 RepID=A0AAJ0HFL6_9PEZI|nr:putative fructosyl amino acid protein [Lasiosphaeria hispida]
MATSPPPLSSFSPKQPPLSFSPPSSILIIGSGVFGLSTAWALARRDLFSQSSITVVDRADPANRDVFPAPDAASIDTSRIVRADYADPAYAALAAEAQVQWRSQARPSDLGAQGRYHESGLVLVADPGPVRQPGEVVNKSEMTGMDYTRFSWANVLSLASRNPGLVGPVQELPDVAAIRDRVGTGGSSGSWGYVNEGSGWANAQASMAWLFDQVKATGRVKFVSGTVVSLEHSGTTVTGASLSDGSVLSAELVIVAAGAWAGSLVNLSGQAIATGQVMGYLDLTEAEQEQLSTMPVVLNMSTGLFVIPPRNRVLKVARHAYGYLNPTSLPTVPLSSITTRAVSASHPLTHLTDPALFIPKEGADELRQALRDMVPLEGIAERPFSRTRLCWYMDTPTADFLVDYHPEFQGLFIATGGSGHAFKFMPVIGDKITDCIAYNCPTEFEMKWNWKPATTFVITEDGTRGGKPGLILANELRAD